MTKLRSACLITRRSMMAGSAASAWAASDVRAAEGVEEVKLAVNALSFVVAVLKIGDQVGIFAQHGLHPNIVVMDSGAAALSALIGGSASFAVNAPSETLAARARGQDVVIVANLYAGMAASLVLGTSVINRLGVLATAPIQDRLRALDGIVIAVPSATSAPLQAIKSAADQAGAKPRFTYMAQGAMTAALEAGAIEGMIAAFPFVGAPILRGTGAIWINGPGGDLPPELRLSSSASVQAAASYARSNLVTVRKLQQAVIATSEFIEKDQPAAKRALAASYPQMSPPEIDLAFSEQWQNWTKPFLTDADIQQDLKLLIASTKAPGLEKIDPKSLLVGPV
jgi:hypothetical protein